MKQLPPLRWPALALLLLLPVLVYWPAIFHRYGLRDDYSVLREAHEEPGKVFQFAASQARPIYGVALEYSFRLPRTIDDLKWLRLGAAVLAGVVAMALHAALRAAGWDAWVAWLTAALLLCVPALQMLVSWAVAWPLALALLLALGGFACAERAFGATGWRRAGGWASGFALVTASALTYQPNSLFYFVLVAAALWSRRETPLRENTAWLARHCITVGLGLFAAFAIMMNAFARGWLPPSRRVALEHDWLGKLGWFFDEPLHNALALLALNHEGGSPAADRAALLVSLVLLAGAVHVWLWRGWRRGVWWLAALVGLLLASFGVNVVAADRWPAYRVLLPLTGVVLVFFVFALQAIGRPWLARATLLGLVVFGAWRARRQTFDLIAWSQGLELVLVERGAARIDPARRPKVFVITPTPFDRATPHVYGDEFGSLSSDSDWTPKEMLKHALRERHGWAWGRPEAFLFSGGRKLPPNAAFDVVIDLRRLRDFRGAPPGAQTPATPTPPGR